MDFINAIFLVSININNPQNSIILDHLFVIAAQNPAETCSHEMTSKPSLLRFMKT